MRMGSYGGHKTLPLHPDDKEYDNAARYFPKDVR